MCCGCDRLSFSQDYYNIICFICQYLFFYFFIFLVVTSFFSLPLFDIIIISFLFLFVNIFFIFFVWVVFQSRLLSPLQVLLYRIGLNSSIFFWEFSCTKFSTIFLLTKSQEYDIMEDSARWRS